MKFFTPFFMLRMAWLDWRNSSRNAKKNFYYHVIFHTLGGFGGHTQFHTLFIFSILMASLTNCHSRIGQHIDHVADIEYFKVSDVVLCSEVHHHSAHSPRSCYKVEAQSPGLQSQASSFRLPQHPLIFQIHSKVVKVIKEILVFWINWEIRILKIFNQKCK